MEILSFVFLNQRHDLRFVFKFRMISKRCKLFSEEWLEILDNILSVTAIDVTVFKNLKKLVCSNHVVDENLQQLKHLTWLSLNHNDKVTDAGLKHLQLDTLYIVYNRQITDDGIKHMQLQK